MQHCNEVAEWQNAMSRLLCVIDSVKSICVHETKWRVDKTIMKSLTRLSTNSSTFAICEWLLHEYVSSFTSYSLCWFKFVRMLCLLSGFLAKAAIQQRFLRESRIERRSGQWTPYISIIYYGYHKQQLLAFRKLRVDWYAWGTFVQLTTHMRPSRRFCAGAVEAFRCCVCRPTIQWQPVFGLIFLNSTFSCNGL